MKGKVHDFQRTKLEIICLSGNLLELLEDLWQLVKTELERKYKQVSDSGFTALSLRGKRNEF